MPVRSSARVEISRRARNIYHHVSLSAAGRRLVVSEGRYPGGAVIATFPYRFSVDVVMAASLARACGRRVHLHDDALLVHLRAWWDGLRSILADSDS